jgi:C4-dicarboxylate-binding protein DctP
MKLTLQITLMLCALAGMAASAPPAGTAEAPTVIRFSHVVTDDTPKGRAARRFKELVETRSQGRVRVEIYPNSSRFTDTQEIRALQLGAVHMLAPSLSKFSPLGIPEFEVFDLPYLFDNYQALRKVTDGPVGEELLKKLEPKGILGLAYWDNGFKVMSANKPLRNPADFKNLKMRIQASKVLDAQMRALGATPQALPFSEAYNALANGAVDGTENPPSNLYTQKMHEVQKHVTVSNHGYLGYAVIVNKKFWEELPRDVRRTLEAALKDATDYANQIARQDNEDALEAVRRSGRTVVHRLSDEEKRAWRRALLGVHREQGERIGRELLAEIYKTTGFAPDKP